MNDEEINRLLRLTFLSEHSTESDNEIVDAMLNSVNDCSSNDTDRIRRLVVERIFLERNPLPIRRIDQKVTFGAWLEKERTSAKLTISEFANALGQDELQIERIEKSQIKPWETSMLIVISLMKLIRLHFEAATELIRTSAAVNQVRGLNAVQARCSGGKMTSSRGDATSRALEMFLANNSASSANDRSVEDWLLSLKQNLLNESLSTLID
jgi:hypothetical protein